MKIGQILIKIGSSMSIWPIIKGVKFGGNASVIVEDICKLSRGLGFYWTQCIYIYIYMLYHSIINYYTVYIITALNLVIYIR